MDPINASTIVSSFAPALVTLVSDQTTKWVETRIAASKDSKNADQVRATYDEIVNKLLSERAEAIRIAQEYQSEIERIHISDDDIAQLHSTIDRLVDLVEVFVPAGDESQRQAVEVIKELINADTLRTLQLLGFNFKEAIGVPLTRLCAEKISSVGKSNVSKAKQGHR